MDDSTTRAQRKPSSDRRDAPPAEGVCCPFCQSSETELVALFGSQLSTVQYFCRACHSPFQYIKQEAS